MKWTTHLLLGLSILMYNLPLSGQQWEDQANGLLPTGYGVFSISVVNEDVVWAVAFDISVLNPPIPLNHLIKVLRTSNGGASWSIYDVEEAIGRLSFDIKAIDSLTAFITTNDYNNGQGDGLFKTVDGGINWTSKLSHPGGGVWIRFFDQNDGVTINRHRGFTTNDAGDTWTQIDSVDLDKFLSNEYTIISTGTNSCVVKDNYIWFGTNQGRVFRSKDKGHMWEAFSTTLTSVHSVAFKDTLTGVALSVGPSGEFAITTDGGETWSTIGPNIWAIRNFCVVPGTDSILIGSRNYLPSSLYSSNLGKTWQIIDMNHYYGATQFISPTLGWTSNSNVGSSSEAAMMKWDSNIFTGISGSDKSFQWQIYPNPTPGRVTIQFDNTLQNVSLVVRNLLGQVVQMQSYNSVDIITTDIMGSQGIYLLELTVSDGNTTIFNVLKE